MEAARDPAAGPRRWVRPEIRALERYAVAPAEGLVKLDAMENPYRWPDEMVAEWLELLRETPVNRYPDPDARAVKAALRGHLPIPEAAGLMVGNGSDELIWLTCLALAGAGRTVMAPEPTFTMYALVARAAGMEYVGVSRAQADFALDLDALLAQMARHEPAVVFLASPNNPTGNLPRREEVERVVEAAPGLVVVDEAYYPFAGTTLLDLSERHPNVLVLQTLSKLGLAGLRLGLLVGHPRWLEQLEKIRLPYNVNVLSQVSAVFALERGEVLAEQTARIRADRERLHERLSHDARVRVWPSDANFLLFQPRRREARAVFEALRERGVLIKCLDGAHPLLAGCLRVTVGTPRENERFLEALDGALEAAH